MKSVHIVLIVLGCLVLSGCSLVSVERYVHEPTSEIPQYLWANQALPKKYIPANGDALLVPDFTTFSASFSGPVSRLVIFTRDGRRLSIVSATLEAPGKPATQSLVLNVTPEAKRLANQEGVWVAYVPLFVDDRVPEKNTDFSRWNGAGRLLLRVQWKDGDHMRESRFELRRVVRKEAAWVT